jgi:hypothetical protein
MAARKAGTGAEAEDNMEGVCEPAERLEIQGQPPSQL